MVVLLWGDFGIFVETFEKVSTPSNLFGELRISEHKRAAKHVSFAFGDL